MSIHEVSTIGLLIISLLTLFGIFSRYYLNKLTELKKDLELKINDTAKLSEYERICEVSNKVFDTREKLVWREFEHSDNNIKSLEKKFDSFSKDMDDKFDKLYDKLDEIYKIRND